MLLGLDYYLLIIRLILESTLPSLEADTGVVELCSSVSSSASLTFHIFMISIGIWRGVSKGVEDGRRPPALQAAHP
jgi:hypothetical protein